MNWQELFFLIVYRSYMTVRVRILIYEFSKIFFIFELELGSYSMVDSNIIETLFAEIWRRDFRRRVYLPFL
jgi:hypothetical protein